MSTVTCIFERRKNSGKGRVCVGGGWGLKEKEGLLAIDNIFRLCGLAFDPLLGTDSEGRECNFRLVKSMHMFIQRIPTAIFACIFYKDTVYKL